MHWKTFLTLAGVFMYLTPFSQQISPEVLSPAGGTDQLKQLSLEWTLGELATETIYSGDLMLTEGFHQPVLIIREIQAIETRSAKASLDLEVTAFPNPVSSTLHVQISTESSPDPLYIVLASAGGKILNRQKVDTGSLNFELDMSPYSAGSFLLTCMREDGSVLRTFRILKSK